jgi:phosphoglucosamine mutase
MQRSGKTLSELAQVMIALPQVLLNVRVERRAELSEFPEITRTIQGIEEKLGEDGRVLIRYSGTEPLLRIMLEGQDKVEITGMAHAIADCVTKHLGGKKEGKK